MADCTDRTRKRQCAAGTVKRYDLLPCRLAFRKFRCNAPREIIDLALEKLATLVS